MKITVRNLGAIQEAEFDLKPLTILIGPNNAGKTWLAYTLAGIFGEYGRYRYLRGYRAEEVAKLYPPIIQAVDKLMTKGTARIDLVRFAQEFGETYFNDVAQQARKWLPRFLNTHLAQFDDLDISIQLEEAKKTFLDRVLNDYIPDDDAVESKSETKSTLRIQKKQNNRYVYLYTVTEAVAEEELPREILEGSLARSLLTIFHHALYPDVAVLPTERSTFITEPHNALMEISSYLSKSRRNVHLSEDKRSVSTDLPNPDIISIMQRLVTSTTVPVMKYQEEARKVAALGSKERIDRARQVEQYPLVQKYMDLAQLLANKILNGTIDFSTQEPEPTRAIHFQPEEMVHPLEISISSSMVKELASLVFYLRYFAMPGELLVIDEPEMNLHPKAQVKIIEFLAMLVNAGLHVLVTTHSPYMVDHLLNLRKASEYEDQEAICDRFFLRNKDAFIDQQKSVVYLVDQGKIKNLLDEEQDEEEEDTFGKISDRISDIYFSF